MQRSKSDRRSLLPVSQLVLVAIITFALLIGYDFSRRLATNRRIAADYAQLQAEITNLEAQQADLKAKKAYVDSDAYVENWARSEGKLVRPGEHLVIPLARPENQPGRGTLPMRSSTSGPNWYSWWLMFFDTPPPEIHVNLP